jgi:hypothetical protein
MHWPPALLDNEKYFLPDDVPPAAGEKPLLQPQASPRQRPDWATWTRGRDFVEFERLLGSP